MTTADAIAAYLAEHDYLGSAPKTIAHYRWSLDRLARAHPALPTERSDMLRVIGDRRLAPSSRMGLWRDYRAFWRWLARHQGVADVMLDVPRPRIRRQLPHVLHDSDLDRLMSARMSRRDRALVSVLLDTGLRSGELAGMRWADVSGDGIRVDGKTGTRVVPLSPHVRQLLVGLGDAEAVWTGRRGPLGNWGVQQAVRRVIYRAGLRAGKSGPHVLRHTFATEYVRGGGNVRVLQQILGHTTLATTMIYVHLAQSDVAADHAAHSPMARLSLVTAESIDLEA